MATQIVIGNESFIKIDDSFHIGWADKGNAMPALPSTLHAMIWNDLVGQNEIQNKLEQLRALDNNIKINVSLAKNSSIGVDTKEDFVAIKKIMEYKQE